MAAHCAHTVHGDEPLANARLRPALILTLGFVVVEYLVGRALGSLALISDALHNLADGVALGVSAFAVYAARRPPDASRTYGFHRGKILAALINAAALAALSVWVIAEAIHRFRDPEPIASGPMILTAVLALAVNITVSVWLHSGAHSDLNIRSAYLHMVFDAMASAGVIVAGLVIRYTGNYLADPLISLLISLLILWSSLQIVLEAWHILMEGVPRGLDLHRVADTIRQVPGVLDCHNLHVWSLGPGLSAASCHIVVADQSAREAQDIARRVQEDLRRHHDLRHCTIQLEVEGCPESGLLCSLCDPTIEPGVAQGSRQGP